MTANEKVPRWDLSPIYTNFGSKEQIEDKELYKSLVKEFDKHMENVKNLSKDGLTTWLLKSIDINGKITTLLENLDSFAYCNYSVDTNSKAALDEINNIEELMLSYKKLIVKFQNIIAIYKNEITELIKTNNEIKKFGFFLTESIFLQTKQMSPEMEDLATDLLRSGGDAWGRLQASISSNTKAVWDEATGETKTVTELRNLAYEEDRNIREKAFKKELEAWKSVEIPIAAAINGVKGFSIALNNRRGWEDSLATSLFQSRISKKTLNALITAVSESFPMWRKYLDNKAKLLGIKKCAFYDLFAPVGHDNKKYTWTETRDIIIKQFYSFSEKMGKFGEAAFDNNWIDAEPRNGKIGGAYCIGFPKTNVSRVMCNFDGNFSSILTVAHELGHAYHTHALKNVHILNTDYPMTLAETASIFSETFVYESLLKEMDESERLGMIESHLQDGCQTLVDILSRFYFEQSLFDKCKTGSASPDELCQMMIDAQKKTYGDGLDPEALHPYMWAVKSHYYSPTVAFYNFPYAFGQLFAMGLYSKWLTEGASFVKKYDDILCETGLLTAEDVCKNAGFDIETPDFWRSSISVFAKQADDFDKIVNK